MNEQAENIKPATPFPSSFVSLLISSAILPKFFRLAARMGCVTEYVFEREVVDQDPFHTPSNVQIKMFRGKQLLTLAAYQQKSLSREILVAASLRDDHCAVAFANDRIVGYSWTTHVSAPYNDTLLVKVPPRFAYGFGAFTDNAFRGNNLYPELIRRAGYESRSQGRNFRVAYVSATNSSSMRGLAKVGYRPVGTLLVLGKKAPFRIIRSKAVKEIGFNLVPREQDMTASKTE